MYGVAAQSILEVRLLGTLHGQTTINTFHYMNRVGVLDGALCAREILTAFDTGFGIAIATRQSDELVDRRLEVQWILATRFTAQKGASLTPHGISLDTSEPSGAAVVVRRTTDFAARKYRGRIFVPAIAEGDVEDSELTDAAVALWDLNIASQMALSITSATEAIIFDPIIWSHSAPARSTFITGGSTDQALRYQRRREVGRGI